AHVLLDVLRELVTGHPDVLVAHDAAQCDHRDLAGAATDVDDHVAHGLLHIDADADGGGHGFVDQIHLLGAGVLTAVLHGALLHFGDAAGDADHHAQVGGEELTPRLDHADHALDHLLGRPEVRDHAVLQRAHGLDVLVGLAVHLLGLPAHGDHLAGG